MLLPAGKAKKAERIGIMGGTFNPIHHGHLVTAEEALYQFQLDRIIFMPTGKPPHKEARDIAPAEDRYLMTVMATAANRRFSVSRLEVDKAAASYTLETVRELRKTYPQDTEIYWITGADAVLDILTWKQPEQIVQLAHFIAATRPGYPIEKLTKLGRFRVSTGANQGGAEISVMEIPSLAVSSSDIRRRIREGRPVRYLLPDGVLEYIDEGRLYRQGE